MIDLRQEAHLMWWHSSLHFGPGPRCAGREKREPTLAIMDIIIVSNAVLSIGRILPGSNLPDPIYRKL